MARTRLSKRQLLFRIVSPVLALVLSVIGAETALQLFTDTLLGRDLTIEFFDRYNRRPHGMYFFEKNSAMNFMRPLFVARAFSKGHFWTHSADQRGFRNPPDRQDTQILLLGDSMIYGHGVEDDQTVASFLHKVHGQPVYNMARQGDCLYDHYVLLRLYLEEFSPRTVLLVVFFNDIYDLLKMRGIDKIVRIPELKEYDYEKIRNEIKREAKRRTSDPPEKKLLLPRLIAARLDSDTVGLAQQHKQGNNLLVELQKHGVLRRGESTLNLEQIRRVVTVPKYRALLLSRWPQKEIEHEASVRQYYRRVLGDLQGRCEELGTRLVLVNLAFYQDGFRFNRIKKGIRGKLEMANMEMLPDAVDYLADYLYRERSQGAASVGQLLYEVAHEVNVDYLDVSPAFEGCGDCYLENDGHFNEKGHRQLAETINDYLSSD